MGMDFPMNLPDMADSQRKAVDGTIAAPVTNSNETNNPSGKFFDSSFYL